MEKIAVLSGFRLGWFAMALGMAGCAPSQPNPLDKMETAKITIGGHVFLAWVAETPSARERGLMFVTKEQMAPLPDGAQRGMLFVWPSEDYRAFWMKNTIIALDIAFIRHDGTIVKTYTMAPLKERPSYYSEHPCQYVLEMNAGVLRELGIKAGDKVEIPEAELNPVPEPSETP